MLPSRKEFTDFSHSKNDTTSRSLLGGGSATDVTHISEIVTGFSIFPCFLTCRVYRTFTQAKSDRKLKTSSINRAPRSVCYRKTWTIPELLHKVCRKTISSLISCKCQNFLYYIQFPLQCLLKLGFRNVELLNMFYSIYNKITCSPKAETKLIRKSSLNNFNFRAFC